MRLTRAAHSIAVCWSVCCNRTALSNSMWRAAVTTDRLHLVEERRVGSILQRQEMGDEARAVFGVHA